MEERRKAQGQAHEQDKLLLWVSTWYASWGLPGSNWPEDERKKEGKYNGAACIWEAAAAAAAVRRFPSGRLNLNTTYIHRAVIWTRGMLWKMMFFDDVKEMERMFRFLSPNSGQSSQSVSQFFTHLECNYVTTTTMILVLLLVRITNTTNAR